MFEKNKKTTVLLVTLLCISITAMSTAAPVESHSLSSAAESLLVGSGQCSDFLNGFALGMGIASFLGCVWCPGVALASKTVEMLAC